MNSISATIVTILNRYHLDNGVVMAKEVGSKGVATVVLLSSRISQKLQQNPASRAILSGYEQNPVGYAESMRDQIASAMQTDANFEREMLSLLRQFEEQIAAFKPLASIDVGSGSVARNAATVVGERGVSVRGNVEGNIITGDGNIIYMGKGVNDVVNFPEELAPLSNKMSHYFNKIELKGLCFELGIADDDLPSETRTELAQSLVRYCYKNGHLFTLSQICRRERAHVDWS